MSAKSAPAARLMGEVPSSASSSSSSASAAALVSMGAMPCSAKGRGTDKTDLQAWLSQNTLQSLAARWLPAPKPCAPAAMSINTLPAVQLKAACDCVAAA